MATRWYTTVVQSTDPRRLGAWWADVLDWELAYEADDEVVIVPRWAAARMAELPFEQVPPGLVFVLVDQPKHGQNRVHLDLAAPLADDREAEIARLLALGATRRDVGQGTDVSWDVFADIDGNEFCLLSNRDD